MAEKCLTAVGPWDIAHRSGWPSLVFSTSFDVRSVLASGLAWWSSSGHAAEAGWPLLAFGRWYPPPLGETVCPIVMKIVVSSCEFSVLVLVTIWTYWVFNVLERSDHVHFEWGDNIVLFAIADSHRSVRTYKRSGYGAVPGNAAIGIGYN